MKCPLMLISSPGLGRQKDTSASDCLKADCAWWIPAFECCAVWEMAIRLASTADQLFNIHDDMPHEEQFRK